MRWGISEAPHRNALGEARMGRSPVGADVGITEPVTEKDWNAKLEGCKGNWFPLRGAPGEVSPGHEAR